MAPFIDSNCCLVALDSLGFCSVPSSPWTGIKVINNCPNAWQKTHQGEMTSSWGEARSYVFTYLLRLFPQLLECQLWPVLFPLLSS